jgi:hypothetical protein
MTCSLVNNLLEALSSGVCGFLKGVINQGAIP